MRYRLRTLMIGLTVGPALIAIAVWSMLHHPFPGVPLSLAVISVPVVMQARESQRNVLVWLLLAWILGYAGAVIVAVTAVEAMLNLLSIETIRRIPDKAVAVPAALIGTYLGASIALMGARRPKATNT